MKICSKCKTEKPLTNFTKVPRNRDGHSAWCKECYSKYHKIWFKQSDRNNENPQYILNGTTKEDYLNMYELMRKLGYDPSQDVSKQFCDKYGLKYRVRRKRDVNAFTYQELKKPPK